MRSLSRAQVADLLEASALPERAKELEIIRAAYGSEADEVSRDQARFLDLTARDYDALKRRILDNWDAVQAIAAQVPPAEQVAKLLETAGGPSRVDQIGISTRRARHGDRRRALPARPLYRAQVDADVGGRS